MSADEKSGRLSRRRFIQGTVAAAAIPLTARARGRDDDDDDDRHHDRDDDRGHAACGAAPDVNLVNGRFLTMDARNRVASALAIRDGRIARVGHAGELGPCGRTMNLRGATVIPGLIDTHVHFLRCGQNPGHEVRIIETAASVAELQQMIRARIAELGVQPGQELVNFITCIGGWNINGLTDKRLPTVAELDAPALMPLPAQRYELARFKTVKVHIFCGLAISVAVESRRGLWRGSSLPDGHRSPTRTS